MCGFDLSPHLSQHLEDAGWPVKSLLPEQPTTCKANRKMWTGRGGRASAMGLYAACTQVRAVPRAQGLWHIRGGAKDNCSGREAVP